MIDAMPLIDAAKNASEMQQEVPYYGPIYWELEHAKSCLLNAHSLITELNAKNYDYERKNRRVLK